jgi:hypothetical protein
MFNNWGAAFTFLIVISMIFGAGLIIFLQWLFSHLEISINWI